MERRFISLFVILCLLYCINGSLLTRAVEHADDCVVVKCVGTGAECNVGESACNASTAYCSDSNRCVAKKGKGESCASHNECLQTFSCSGGKCEPNGYVKAGLACTANDQCIYFDDNDVRKPSECINGLCYGKKLGEQCKNNHQCAGYTWCNEAGVCANIPKIGEKCNQDVGCEGVAYCRVDQEDEKKSECRPFFAEPLGAACAQMYACQEGLYCNFESQRCIEPPKATNKSCKNYEDCPFGEVCTCNFLNGVGNCETLPGLSPVGATAAFKELFACIYEYMCDDADTSCMLRHCKVSACNAFSYVGYKKMIQASPTCLMDEDILVVKHVCGW